MLTSEIIKILTRFYLFQGVDSERLEILTSNSSLVELENEDVIFYKNDQYHKGLYLLLDGKVLLDSDDSGSSLTIGTGDLIGLSTFLAKSRYSVTAKCAEGCSLIFFPETCIYKLMSDYANFKEKLQKLIFARINGLSGSKTDSILHSTFKSVGTYMMSPVMTVKEDDNIKDAAVLMSRHKIGSVVVTCEHNRFIGVITAKSVIYRLFNDGSCDIVCTDVKDYMTPNPVHLSPEHPLVNALSEMQKQDEDYAVVVRNSEPVGIISGKDILRILFSDASIYGIDINETNSLERLQEVHIGLYTIAEQMMNNSKLTSQILPVLTSMHIEIQKRIYSITSDNYLKETGKDIRLIKHAVIVMGSVARKEAMLDPDQDNGFVFPDDITEEDKGHLVAFAKKLSDNLDFVGYEYCKGDVMVTNPEMQNTISEWKKLISGWVDNPGEKGLRWSSITFDVALLAGTPELAMELKQFILFKTAQRPVFLLQTLQADANLKIPISLFGKFVVEKEGEYKGLINLKRAALSFIVDVTRCFTLSKSFGDLNTIERLKHLGRQGTLAEETVSNMIHAYEIVTDIILNSQIALAKEGEKQHKFVNPHKLSLYNQERLKNALNHISKFLNSGLRYFSGSPF
ncbi:putative CBS domain and cyclic nucleotide- regulated nucleotidyltransferase [Denitrovibrio acetiphilus DSM 12809]|uniref:Putative CBS domain and cyclic nucleotide-regulated nucleotidyltransferase n=2 Tax=Denitrovibrio TaxID=117999 RepID=D4H7M1_DENA2|nr:putative CBS domain and cyclic nucleotide- regulated nucleotidyltransferase [Denitrovibrio acetiphilus DSM 12809]